MRKIWKYISPGLYGLLIYFTIRGINDTVDGGRFWERELALNTIEIITAILLGYLSWWLLYWLEARYLNQNTEVVTTRRVAKELLMVIGLSLVIVNLTVVPMAALTDDGLSLADAVQLNVIPMLYLLIISAIRRGNYYIRQYIDSKIRLERLEKDRIQSELDFLKGQFSPHFLFNGLNNIYFQMDQSVADAKESVEKLSELLRYQLYQSKTVPLSRESEFIGLYIEVHRLRKQANLRVNYQPSKSTTQVQPHLFLPLVENAFKYAEGTEPYIDITMQEAEGQVVFEVTNTCRAGQSPRAEGIGLKNLQRRLELLYPRHHRLQVTQSGDTFHVHLSFHTS